MKYFEIVVSRRDANGRDIGKASIRRMSNKKGTNKSDLYYLCQRIAIRRRRNEEKHWERHFDIVNGRILFM